MIKLRAFDRIDGRLFYENRGKIYFGRLPFENLETLKKLSSEKDLASALTTLEFTESEMSFEDLAQLQQYAVAEYQKSNIEDQRDVDSEAETKTYIENLDENSLKKFIEMLLKEMRSTTSHQRLSSMVSYIYANPFAHRLPRYPELEKLRVLQTPRSVRTLPVLTIWASVRSVRMLVGSVQKGTIRRIGRASVLVELADRTTGICAIRSLKGIDGLIPRVGEELDFQVDVFNFKSRVYSPNGRKERLKGKLGRKKYKGSMSNLPTKGFK